MKKIILMAVAALLVFSLAACSRDNKSTQGADIPSEPNTSANQESAKIQTYMGQVKEKVGNDITLSLGNPILENENGEGQTMMVDENGNQIPVDDNISDGAGGETIMIPMPDDESGSTEGGSGDGEIEKLPIEFTGEVQNFTIPAGAKIVNGMGKETTLDSVKKGSLVQLIVNETNGVVETVMVW